MDLLVQLEQHRWIEAHLIVFPNEVEDESLAICEVYIDCSVDSLGLEPLSEEANRDEEELVLLGI